MTEEEVTFSIRGAKGQGYYASIVGEKREEGPVLKWTKEMIAIQTRHKVIIYKLGLRRGPKTYRVSLFMEWEHGSEAKRRVTKPDPN